MKHQDLTLLNPEAPYIPFHSGYYEREIQVPGGESRRLLIYIPENTRSSTAGVFLLPPGGVSAERFLAESNWVDIADGEETKEKLVLFVVESRPEGWHVDEPYGAPDGDVAYLHGAYQTGSLRVLSCVHEAKYYLVGYQDGGAAAQMTAMWDPAAYAGVASVDSPPLSPAYLEEAGRAFAVNLDGFEDAVHSRNIRKKDIPMPAWLISSEWPDQTPEALYWRQACGCGPEGRLRDFETREFVRTAETEYPLNQEKAACRVWTSRIPHASDELGRKLNRRIWKDFLYGVRRWMADPGGNLRLTRDPVRDLHMEYHYEMVDGFRREWYIHVPEQVRANPDKPVPLVFAMHGYSCSGEIYIGNSEWHKVADRYGFIAVFPTAVPGIIHHSHPKGGVSPDNVPWPTWNTFGRKEGRPYENAFFAYMMEDVCRRFPVDRSRVYATGHSNGNMMTQWLALTRPEWFAAVAPCSGILHMAGAEEALKEPEVQARKQVDLPIWMFGGEREEWLLDGAPAPDNRTGKTLYTWWEMNRMPGEKPAGFGTPSVHAGRWRDWSYEKQGVPMIRFTGIEYFPHATMPEMSFRIWEEFFSKFRRGEDGSVIYNNEGTP